MTQTDINQKEEMSVEEKSILQFQQQCDKCFARGDSFLNITVNSQEMHDLLMEFREALVTVYTNAGKNGEALVNNLFPKTNPQVYVCEDVESPISFMTMGMAEYESLHETTIRAMAFFANEMAPRLGIPTVTVTDEQGKQHSIAPLLYDYNMFKQAIINKTVDTMFNVRMNEYEMKQSGSRIQTVSASPDTLKILKG